MTDFLLFLHTIFNALSVFLGGIASVSSLVSFVIWLAVAGHVVKILGYSKQVKFLISGITLASMQNFLDSAYWGISWPLDAFAGADGTSSLFKYTGALANVLFCQAPTILVAYCFIKAVEDHMSKNVKIALWTAASASFAVGVALVVALET